MWFLDQPKEAETKEKVGSQEQQRFFFFITKDHEFSLTKTKQTKQNGAMNVMELFSLIFILFYITSYTYSIFLYKKKEFTEYFIYTN